MSSTSPPRRRAGTLATRAGTRSRDGAALLLLLATLALAAGGCHRESAAPEPRVAAHHGPIVFITLDALRADAVGAFGGPPKLTPHLDDLAREASWAGAAVAPSSWTVPSMASLFTGLQPWRNQSFQTDDAVLRPELVTLPESLRALGYETTGFFSNVWLRDKYGYNQGFDSFRYFREGRRAEQALAQLQDRPQFFWAHILPPHAPYLFRKELRDRLPDPALPLPPKVTILDLEPYMDPAAPLPADAARTFRAMYQMNVTWADQVLGRLLAALKRSGQWERTLLVVTSDHGEEFKECGQIEHGGNVCRALLEVPLLVKLPKAWSGPRLAIARGERPATARVRATMIEAAGGTPESDTAPSLFHAAPPGVLSELYSVNGSNLFSLVEGDRQVIWKSAFTPPSPEYFRAHWVSLGGQPPVPPKEPPPALFARFDQAFRATLPLSGARGTQPELTLWQWGMPAAGASMANPVTKIEDARAAHDLARRLRAAWLAANGAETAPGARRGQRPQLTPEEEAEIRALGYASGGQQ